MGFGNFVAKASYRYYLDREHTLCKTNQQIACTHGYILRNYTVASNIFERGNAENPLLDDIYYEQHIKSLSCISAHFHKKKINFGRYPI